MEGDRAPRNPRYGEIAAKLRASPGKWVFIEESTSRSLAVQWGQGVIVALRKELGYTITTRKNPTGTRSYWGVFNPENVESDEEIERLRRERRDRRNNYYSAKEGK